MRTFKLTADEAMEVNHKLTILIHNDDAEINGEPLTEAQRAAIKALIPRNGPGVFNVPDEYWDVIREEMLDHVKILRACSDAARDGGEMGQALRIAKQAMKFERMFE